MNNQESALVLSEKDQIIKVIEDTFYPLDYGRWQGDELLEAIISVIKGHNE